MRFYAALLMSLFAPLASTAQNDHIQLTPCSMLDQKAKTTWQQSLSTMQVERCKYSKFHCPRAEETMNKTMERYRALMERCIFRGDVTEKEVRALPPLKPDMGYVCCFGEKMPPLLNKESVEQKVINMQNVQGQPTD